MAEDKYQVLRTVAGGGQTYSTGDLHQVLGVFDSKDIAQATASIINALSNGMSYCYVRALKPEGEQ